MSFLWVQVTSQQAHVGCLLGWPKRSEENHPGKPSAEWWEVAEKEDDRGLVQGGKVNPVLSCTRFPQFLKLMPLLRRAQTLPQPNPGEQPLQVNCTCTQLLHCIWPCLPAKNGRVLEGKKLHMWIMRNTRENPISLCHHWCSVPLPGSGGSVPQEAPGWISQQCLTCPHRSIPSLPECPQDQSS